MQDEILEIIVKVLEQQSIVFPIMFDQIAREVSKTVRPSFVRMHN